MTWQVKPRKVWRRGEKVATAIAWAILLGTIAACGLISIAQGRAERARAALNVSTVTVLAGIKPCGFEDGSGADQTYPCQWDARSRGNGEWGESIVPVLVYVRGTDAGCPRLPAYARCVDVDS